MFRLFTFFLLLPILFQGSDLVDSWTLTRGQKFVGTVEFSLLSTINLL